MKKVIMLAFAAALFAIPATQAQKVNKSALLAKIAKSDAEIADAKKNGKAATWINRGKTFCEVAIEPTKSLFIGMEATMLKLSVGEPQAVEQQTLAGAPAEAWVYPYFTAFVRDGKVATWRQTQTVSDMDVVAKSIEAYNKAFELDPKSGEKVKAGLKAVSDYCSQAGNASLDAQDYAAAADAYAQAFEAQSSPAYGGADPELLYYAGYLRTIDGSANPASFKLGEGYLAKAIDMNYADAEGNIYYYLFHCYYGQKGEDAGKLTQAKEALLAGIDKFPSNKLILEGLMQLYTSEQGVGDPADLITMFESSISADPENIDLWMGRGRIFFALKDYDESIASFRKIVELRPDLFEGQFFTGYFCVCKGDAMNDEINARSYSSQAAYDADLKQVNEVYLAAVPYFEKAHELKPDDVDTLEILKQLCFRLRDEEGMMDKYNTYNVLYKQAKGIE